MKIQTPNKFLENQCNHCINGKLVNPKWLRFIRRKKDITMINMAKKIGISQSYLCDIEQGKRSCPRKVIEEYSK